MIKDEFNDVKVSNESSIRKAEFGPTQKTEFSEQGQVTRKKASHSNMPKESTPASEAHASTTAEVVSSAAPAATTVTSSATAGSIAATTTSVVVVASTVAVTAISVVTGISVSLHDYQFKFNSFIVTSESLTYELLIIDNKNRPDDQPYESYEQEPDYNYEEGEYKEPFTLRVYNTNYDYSMGAWLDEPNYGSFSGLKLDEKYRVVLSENRYGGEVLFDEEFTTKKGAAFTDFYISGESNSFSRTFETYLDYVDELDALSDFTINFTRDSYEIAIPLAKQTGWQSVDVTEFDFDLNGTYDYTFTYKNNGDVNEFSSGTVTFYDTFSGESVVRGVTWDKTANFLTNETTIQLDFQDDYELFSDFKFTLVGEAVTAAPEELVYSLQKTTEPQNIDLSMNSSFDLAMTYNYAFSYVEGGETKTIDSGEVHFEDNSGAESIFNNFIFDKTANFINKTFDVQLDFADDFNVYDEFALTFFMDDSGLEISIPLEKTTEVQTINAEDNDISLSNTYTYQLSCLYYGEKTILDSGEVTFTDNSGAIVEFYGLIFDKTANFDNRTFDVKLDYRDDLDYLYGFEFTLEDLETKQSKTFSLTKTDEVQTLFVDETSGVNEYDEPIYLIDVAEHTMQYSFKYWNVDQEIIVVSEESFTFKNSLVSEFFGVDSSYDFVSDTSDGPFMLPIKFDFDDAAHIYSDFNVTFSVDSQEVGYLMFEGSNVQKCWQYGTYQAIDDLMMAEDLTESSSPVMMNISAMVPETDENPTGILHLLSKEVSLTMNTTKAIYGATVVDDYLYYGSYEITILPIYAGEPDEIECELIIECNTGNTYTCNVNLDGKNVYSTVLLTECENFNEETFGEDFENPVKISLRYCTITYDSGSGTGTSDLPEPIKSEYYTMVLYDSFKFTLSA